MSDVHYRVGRSWGTTIVAEEDGKPDRLMGTMQTKEDAHLVVNALNLMAEDFGPAPKACGGGPIPLSEQAVHHLSPGCRCVWSTFYDTTPSTVGITGQAEDCPVHPKRRQGGDGHG